MFGGICGSGFFARRGGGCPSKGGGDIVRATILKPDSVLISILKDRKVYMQDVTDGNPSFDVEIPKVS